MIAADPVRARLRADPGKFGRILHRAGRAARHVERPALRIAAPGCRRDTVVCTGFSGMGRGAVTLIGQVVSDVGGGLY